MTLAIFDLDNTLLAGDSDYLWGRFLVGVGAVDGDAYEAANERFYRDYRDGQLDIGAFLAFSLRPLAEHSRTQLDAWHARFMAEQIEPIVTSPARELVERHRGRGDTLMIITATNAFVTAPIAARFGIGNLIATEPEQVDGRFTGRVSGTPSFREGKVARLNEWLQDHDESLHGAYFYSDSHNDLPLLERVDHPVAVDPDERLARHAADRDWPVISLLAGAPSPSHRHL